MIGVKSESVETQRMAKVTYWELKDLVPRVLIFEVRQRTLGRDWELHCLFQISKDKLYYSIFITKNNPNLVLRIVTVLKTCSITTEHSDLLMILTHQLVCVVL